MQKLHEIDFFNLLKTSLQLRLIQDPSALAEMIAERVVCVSPPVTRLWANRLEGLV